MLPAFLGIYFFALACIAMGDLEFEYNRKEAAAELSIIAILEIIVGVIISVVLKEVPFWATVLPISAYMLTVIATLMIDWKGDYLGYGYSRLRHSRRIVSDILFETHVFTIALVIIASMYFAIATEGVDGISSLPNIFGSSSSLLVRINQYIFLASLIGLIVLIPRTPILRIMLFVLALTGVIVATYYLAPVALVASRIEMIVLFAVVLLEMLLVFLFGPALWQALEAETDPMWGAVFVLVAIVFLIMGPIVVSVYVRDEVIQMLTEREIGTYADSYYSICSASAIVAPPKLASSGSEGVIIMDSETGEVRTDLTPFPYQAYDETQVRYLLCVIFDEKIVGQYGERGILSLEGDQLAIQHIWHASMFDLERGEVVIVSKTFTGGLPPEVINRNFGDTSDVYGSSPDDEFSAWIDSLIQERARES